MKTPEARTLSTKVVVSDVATREVLTTETAHKLSRQAQTYIYAYYSFYKSQNRGDDTIKLTLPLVGERLVKAFKTHCAAIDFNEGFVYGIVPNLKDGVIVITEYMLIEKKVRASIEEFTPRTSGPG
jgi:hypothetical protein